MQKFKILIVIGTRPEAIKLAPVIKALQKNAKFDSKVCVTAQHRSMMDQVLGLFRITPDFDLDLMKEDQTLTDITCHVLQGMSNVFRNYHPDLVIVQGDTTTTFATGLSSFYNKIPVFHVEAGLRTNNLFSPWPEELNRVLTTRLSTYHFAPTDISRNNLLKESVPKETISVTGNTVIDSLFEMIDQLNSNKEQLDIFNKKYKFLDRSKYMILITGHRRENFGEGFESICLAIKNISMSHDVDILYPVHLNQNVQEPVNRILSNLENVNLVEPVGYLEFIYLMNRSYIILTDSGGVQEEAPSLGKPVIVMRDTTERTEAINAGTVKLVGTNQNLIEESVRELLESQEKYDAMSKAHNPYGDGYSSDRIVEIIEHEYKL